jgi:hypothetical protein
MPSMSDRKKIGSVDGLKSHKAILPLCFLVMVPMISGNAGPSLGLQTDIVSVASERGSFPLENKNDTPLPSSYFGPTDSSRHDN